MTMAELADFVDDPAEECEVDGGAEADRPHEPLEAAIEFRRELVVVPVRLIRAALGFVVGGAGGLLLCGGHRGMVAGLVPACAGMTRSGRGFLPAQE